jgi:tetratricopeptide (TPR) repeat protein
VDDYLAALLTLSYDRLAEEDAALAQRCTQLAVFPAGFLGDAAAAVWDLPPTEAQSALDTLLARSLVQLEGELRRYRLHDLLCDLARDKADVEILGQAEQRHAEHYMAVLGGAKELYKAGSDKLLKGLRLFDAERANIEAGQAWAIGRLAASEDAARLAFGFTNAGAYVLDLRLTPRQRIGWLESALEGCRRTGHRQGEGATLGNLGIAWKDLGEARKAIGYYEQGLAITREIGDQRGEGSALGNLGVAWAALGEARKATGYYEQRLVIAREIGDRGGEGRTLNNLAQALDGLGERQCAIAHGKGSLLIKRAIEDPRTSEVEAWLRERGVEV